MTVKCRLSRNMMGVAHDRSSCERTGLFEPGHDSSVRRATFWRWLVLVAGLRQDATLCNGRKSLELVGVDELK